MCGTCLWRGLALDHHDEQTINLWIIVTRRCTLLSIM